MKQPRIISNAGKTKDSAAVYWQIINRNGTKQFREELRQEIIREYGGKCVCCGESQEGFLTIDHIFRDGGSERKDLAKRQISLYQHLKAEGFPKDRYRLYCMNCNWASRHTGKCPHENEKSG